jgi:L-lactate dehydrogenase complex protein LldE
MFWGEGLFVFPLTLFYTAISYSVFRGKVRPTAGHYRNRQGAVTMATTRTMATTTVSTDTPRQDAAARENARPLDELRTRVGRRQRMRIGLFIPCYIDAFFPEVGVATLELLQRFGHDIEYPHDQTCCGQPMANSGFNAEAAGTEALFVRNFSGFDYVVAPSGSCVHHVRDNFDAIEQTDVVKLVRARTYELVEFLHDILKVDAFPWASFPHRVGLHNSCGTLRRLKHARPSELHEPFFSKPMDLLSKVEGIEFVQPARPDECCGFGGTFSVFDEIVSTKMGYDKVRDHAQAGAEYIVSADSSCLMHQQGCAERIGVPMKFIHIAQILNGASA